MRFPLTAAGIGAAVGGFFGGPALALIGSLGGMTLGGVHEGHRAEQVHNAVLFR